MHFSLIHLGEVPSEDEEAFIVIPGGAKTVIAVPLDALPHFLPLLAQAASGLPPPRCPACSARLPATIDAANVDTPHG
jgi:hypothetical protein